MAWAYTIFENMKLFRSNEIMSQFYAILMGEVRLGLALQIFVPSIDQLCPYPFKKQQVSRCFPPCRGVKVCTSSRRRQ